MVKSSALVEKRSLQHREIKAPVRIGRRRYRLSWQVVEAHILFLWEKESMKKASMLLDLSKDRARVKGEWMELMTTKGSHCGINMLPKSGKREQSEIEIEADIRDNEREAQERRDYFSQYKEGGNSGIKSCQRLHHFLVMVP